MGLRGAAHEIPDKVLLTFIFTEPLGAIDTIVRVREVVAEPLLLIGIPVVTVSIE